MRLRFVGLLFSECVGDGGFCNIGMRGDMITKLGEHGNEDIDAGTVVRL